MAATFSSEPSRVYLVSGGGTHKSGSSTNHAGSANSTSLPDLLRRSGSSNKRKKRRSALAVDEQLSKIELIQDFEFPEASNKITSTRDGLNIVATGTYKPQIRVWENEQLSLKFERHTDAENVDFKMLSDDWTKSLHLQSDRTVEFHAQGGTHTRVRIPKFGRCIDYDFPRATGLVGSSSREVYRLNLDLGQFLAPFNLGIGSNGEDEGVTGCNSMDINPAHGLLSFGTEGAGTIELWDPRVRTRVGKLSILTQEILDASLLSSKRGLPALALPGENPNTIALQNAKASLSVSALCSAEDGLNLAAGTSTGHILLYDLRMKKPYLTKDQGFSLPIHTLSWPGDNRYNTTNSNSYSSNSNSTAAQDHVLSSDSKVVKIWNKNDGKNLTTISPPAGSESSDINHVHHLPGTGLVVAAVEGTQMGAWYVPSLGPAPKWCSFLDTVTTEMDELEDGKGTSENKGVYEDFKFVDKEELDRLSLTHLLGTSLLRPYMHGYFMSLSLYSKARLLNNPTAYADAREKAIQSKLDKKAESRIRTSKNAIKKSIQEEGIVEGLERNVKVNKELAEKVRKDALKEEKKRKRKEDAISSNPSIDFNGDEEKGIEKVSGRAAIGLEADLEPGSKPIKSNLPAPNLLTDSRFGELFTNPEFEVDPTSREFAMLNPSTTVPKSSIGKEIEKREARDGPRKLTAVEQEMDESDRESLDPDVEDEEQSEEDVDEGGDSGDSSDEGDLAQYNPRYRSGASTENASYRRVGGSGPRLINDDDEADIADGFGSDDDNSRFIGKKRTFEERIRGGGRGRGGRGSSRGGRGRGSDSRRSSSNRGGGDDQDGFGKSMSWVPGDESTSKSNFEGESSRGGRGGGGRGGKDRGRGGRSKDTFAHGLSKGAGKEQGSGVEGLKEEDRMGRTKRRNVGQGRSASKNSFRR